jgi:hypothetical protein
MSDAMSECAISWPAHDPGVVLTHLSSPSQMERVSSSKRCSSALAATLATSAATTRSPFAGDRFPY